MVQMASKSTVIVIGSIRTSDTHLPIPEMIIRIPRLHGCMARVAQHDTANGARLLHHRTQRLEFGRLRAAHQDRGDLLLEAGQIQCLGIKQRAFEILNEPLAILDPLAQQGYIETTLTREVQAQCRRGAHLIHRVIVSIRDHLAHQQRQALGARAGADVPAARRQLHGRWLRLIWFAFASLGLVLGRLIVRHPPGARTVRLVVFARHQQRRGAHQLPVPAAALPRAQVGALQQRHRLRIVAHAQRQILQPRRGGDRHLNVCDRYSVGATPGRPLSLLDPPARGLGRESSGHVPARPQLSRITIGRETCSRVV